MTDKSIWDKPIPVPERLIEYVDQGIRDKLPPGTKIQGIRKSGASYWAQTAKILATDEEGNPTPFFIKVHQFEHGKNMVSAEYFSMSLLHSIFPELVAEPLAWGAYAEEPETYFFLCRFHEFSDELPDQEDFVKIVADFHKRGRSTTGEFGFPVTTYGGRNPQTFPMCKSWEECFSKGLEKLFDTEEETHGPDEEMRSLREGFMMKVIPRLLRPLETEGRTLVPTLVHGDLWDGNVSVDADTNRPMIFDASPLYAHDEYELAPWALIRHNIGRSYIDEYLNYRRLDFPAEPKEDFEDRLLVYALRFDLLSSSLYPGNLHFRGLVLDTMRRLVEKYPLGYEGYQLERGLVPIPNAATSNALAAEENRAAVAEGFQGAGTQGDDKLEDGGNGGGVRVQDEKVHVSAV